MPKSLELSSLLKGGTAANILYHIKTENLLPIGAHKISLMQSNNPAT